ncbi:predicted protein [Postia placenta Mad-698-R]|nr:predicted protein [Postia placenta Mad-698-R]
MYVMVQDVRQLGPSERASRDSTKFRVASQDCPANVSSDQEVGAGERGEATDEQEVRGMYDADQPRTSVRGERNVDLQILQDPETISTAEVELRSGKGENGPRMSGPAAMRPDRCDTRSSTVAGEPSPYRHSNAVSPDVGGLRSRTAESGRATITQGKIKIGDKRNETNRHIP